MITVAMRGLQLPRRKNYIVYITISALKKNNFEALCREKSKSEKISQKNETFKVGMFTDLEIGVSLRWDWKWLGISLILINTTNGDFAGSGQLVWAIAGTRH